MGLDRAWLSRCCQWHSHPCFTLIQVLRVRSGSRSTCCRANAAALIPGGTGRAKLNFLHNLELGNCSTSEVLSLLLARVLPQNQQWLCSSSVPPFTFSPAVLKAQEG